MGIPLESLENPSLTVNSASYAADINGNANGIGPSAVPNYIFVYGDSRPDAAGNPQSLAGVHNKRAWLLGSRLYSFNTGGVRRAAVRLEEFGHAVLGYAVSTNNSVGMTRLLDEYERREYSPELYERDIVEVCFSVITERGERLQSYIYHRSEVNPSNIIPTGDWLRQ